jgi:hypothetical protein
MQETTIDITGLSKPKVLAALFNSSKQQGMGFLNAQGAKPLTLEEAEGILKEQNYFDYLRGRVMKVDLKGDSLDPWLYDRDNGTGAAERAISSIR